MSGETPDDNDQCDEANKAPPSSRYGTMVLRGVRVHSSSTSENTYVG